jgi:sugar phosphate isomerase/epimerase
MREAGVFCKIIPRGFLQPPCRERLMKISYLVYDPVPDLSELARRMETVAALGYHGIELVATYPLGYTVEEVAALAEHHRLPVVSLLSGWSYANEGLCLSSPDSGVRDRAVARLGDYVRWAARLGALVVVGLMQGLRSDEPDEGRANERIAGCLRRVAETAGAHGVSVVLEPVNHLQVGFNHTAAAAAALADRVGSPALGYMLDTIHMNIEERSVEGTIRRHGPRARHFHLCETNGGPFGTGGLDFRGVLWALDEAGYDRFASVKIYREAGWEAAARSAAEFLRGCGVSFRSRPGPSA